MRIDTRQKASVVGRQMWKAPRIVSNVNMSFNVRDVLLWIACEQTLAF